MVNQVLIVGAGALGRAIATTLDGRARISMYDIDPTTCPAGCARLEEAVLVADVVLMCVPSWAMRAALASVAALVRPQTIVASFAKGLEEKTGKSMDHVLAETLPAGQPHAIIGGALLAGELQSGLPGKGVIAGSTPPVALRVQELWHGSAVDLQRVTDMRTLAVCGVLKNIYAVACGIVDGLGFGENAKGWLLVSSLDESRRILSIMHADEALFLTMAGLGDLAATAYSPQSKNHLAGMQLARTGRVAIRCEGITSLPEVMRIIDDHTALPVLAALNAVIIDHKNIRAVFQELIAGTVSA
jgi:glycerol-3-phosphate dehydrogenase (NAD(P)+)